MHLYRRSARAHRRSGHPVQARRLRADARRFDRTPYNVTMSRPALRPRAVPARVVRAAQSNGYGANAGPGPGTLSRERERGRSWHQNTCVRASASTSRALRCPTRSLPLLDRRVVRRYRDEPVPDSLLDALLAAAQSAPAKSDLQQYSVVVMRDRARIKQIADWIGTMDWIATAPVFLVWCGDMRRGQRLCEHHDMPHANNNLDTFLNTAVDCSLAMGAFMAAAEAVGLGTCPISYVRSHIERVSPLLGLPSGVYPVAGLTVGWPVFRRPVSMRLPPSVVVHRERYDDSAMPERSRRLRRTPPRARPGRRRRPEEQRRLSAARRRGLERECRAPALGAGTLRLRRLFEDKGIRSCLKTTRIARN